MLPIAENATEIAKRLAAEITVLRTATEPNGEALHVSAASAVAPHDQDGATIYVDQPASEFLADKVLHGSVNAEGNIRSALGQQA